MTIVSHGRPGKTQNIPYTATPATSAAFGPHTNRIRVCATTAANVTIGDAVAMYVPPNFPEVLLVSAGQAITVTQFAAAGNLNITELE